jgi:uncharacterized protein (DUF1778 family)
MVALLSAVRFRVVKGGDRDGQETERTEIRTVRHVLRQAAQAQHTSISAFVLDAATTAADVVLARADRTLMPADQFDGLMAALDEPDEAPALAALAAKPRKFRRS